MRYDPDRRKSITAKTDADEIVRRHSITPAVIDLPGAETAARDRLARMAGTEEEGHWHTVLHFVQTRTRLQRILLEYTGQTQEYQLHQDPRHPWMWAVRDENGEDHLVNLNTGDVEWVEYTCWPPRSF